MEMSAIYCTHTHPQTECGHDSDSMAESSDGDVSLTGSYHHPGGDDGTSATGAMATREPSGWGLMYNTIFHNNGECYTPFVCSSDYAIRFISGGFKINV